MIIGGDVLVGSDYWIIVGPPQFTPMNGDLLRAAASDCTINTRRHNSD